VLGSAERDPREPAALAAIRTRRVLVWGWLVLALPLVLGVGVLAPAALDRVMGGWALVWIVSIWRDTMSQCPSCKKAFNHAGLRNNPWTSECMNCGLALNGGGVAPPRV